MKNRYRLGELARQHGVPLKKTLKTFVAGKLVVLEVDRPLDEVADELRDLGALK